MKITKLSVMAALAVGALLACSTAAMAQDNKGEGKGGKKGGYPSVDQQLERYTTELKLTDEQKPKVKTVLEERDKKMQATRDLPQDERRQKFMESREEMGKKFKEILTPEQYTKWEQMPQRGGGKKGGGNNGGGEKKDSTEKKN